MGIERKHQKGESVKSTNQDNLSQKCHQLEEKNELLQAQYENLKQELRLLKNSAAGVMVSDYRKAVRAGIDLIAEMLEQVKTEVQTLVEMRDFVKAFHEQKMTIKEFLGSLPVLKRMSQEMMEELLEQMLEEMGIVVEF